MPFRISILDHPPIVQLEHYGDCSPDELHQGRLAAIKKLNDSGLERLFVDARNLPTPDANDSVIFSAQHSIVFPLNTRVAIWLRESEMPTGKISETIARSQQLNIRFFTDSAAATAWLLSGLK